MEEREISFIPMRDENYAKCMCVVSFKLLNEVTNKHEIINHLLHAFMLSETPRFKQLRMMVFVSQLDTKKKQF